MKTSPVSTCQHEFDLTKLKFNALQGLFVLITQLPQHIAKEHRMTGVAGQKGWQHPLEGGGHPGLLLSACLNTPHKNCSGDGIGVDCD